MKKKAAPKKALDSKKSKTAKKSPGRPKAKKVK
jgi:hypothetical protein